MMPESDQSREEKAIKLAEERGRRQQIVDGRLTGLENHAKVVDGSIERLAQSQEKTERKVDDLAREYKTDLQVRKSLAKSASEAAEAAKQSAEDSFQRQVGTRQFWLGVGLVLVGLLGVIATVMATAIH